MHCNGKCQMMKKLKEQENKDKQIPNRRSESQEEVLSSKSFFATIHPIEFCSKISYPLHKVPFAVHRTFDIFHPPKGTCNYIV